MVLKFAEECCNMKRKLLLTLLLGCAILLCVAVPALADDLVADADWVPPDLSDAGTDHPELLILKVAQE